MLHKKEDVFMRPEMKLNLINDNDSKYFFTVNSNLEINYKTVSRLKSNFYKRFSNLVFYK